VVKERRAVSKTSKLPPPTKEICHFIEQHVESYILVTVGVIKLANFIGSEINCFLVVAMASYGCVQVL
jgi:hypothetical protein